MDRRRSTKPHDQVKIAKERIDILFKEAEHADKKLADRYVQIARKIGMRYNVRMGEHKRSFCKYCYSYIPKTSHRRLKNGLLKITCSSCKKIINFPYKPRT